MKKYLILLAMLALVVCAAPAQPPEGGASFGEFYSSLDQYGEWIALDGGVYAWRPLNVEADWRPYSYGHWEWTDYGWYWMSDEPWAWAVYHYGRWYYDDYYGWVWIPGYDWSPAWVEWRDGNDCVGWAPLGPYAVFSPSFGIFYRTAWVTPYSYWSFTDYYHLTNADLHQNIYRTSNNTRYIGQTRSSGNVQYEGGRIVSRGPDRHLVERRGGVRLVRTDIVDANQRRPERLIRNGDEKRLEVYRPSLGRADGSAPERPGRVRDADRQVNLNVNDLDVRARAQDRQVDLQNRPTQRIDEQRQSPPMERLRRPEPQQREIRRENDTRVYERPRLSRPETPYTRPSNPPPHRENVDRGREVRPAERPPVRHDVERAPSPPPKQESSHGGGRKRD